MNLHYRNLRWIMDQLNSISMAYKSLDLLSQVFRQKVPYQVALLQGHFLFLVDTFIHGEKDLP